MPWVSRSRRPTSRVDGGGARIALAACLLVVGGGVIGYAKLRGHDAGTASVEVASAAPEVEQKPRLPVVGIGSFADAAGVAEYAWVPSALEELTRLALHEESRVEVASGADVRADAVLEARLSSDGEALWVDVQLFDVASGALRLAERVPLVVNEADGEPRIMEATDALLGPVRRSLGGRDGAHTSVADLTTDSVTAWRAYLAGVHALAAGEALVAESGFREAARIDDGFFHPRATLVDLMRQAGRSVEAERLMTELAPLAEDAGQWGQLTWRALAARHPAERAEALAALQQRFPRDAGITVSLARALADAGDPAACVREASAALAADASRLDAYRVLATCELAAGDFAAASDTAARHVEAAPRDARAHLTAADVHMRLGRYGSARLAYRTAEGLGSPVAPVGSSMASILGRGKCSHDGNIATQADTQDLSSDEASELALGRGYAAFVCGDAAELSDTVRWLRAHQGGEPAAEELDLLRSIRRREAGSFERAVRRARDETLWTASEVDRVRRYMPVLVAGRSQGSREKAAEALEVVGAGWPSDRYAVWGAPLGFELALTSLAAGDVEEAAESCRLVAEAAPRLALASYCMARVAQAEGEGGAAFRHFRDFLDRWTEADPANAWLVDGKSRLRDVIRDNRSSRG